MKMKIKLLLLVSLSLAIALNACGGAQMEAPLSEPGVAPEPGILGEAAQDSAAPNRYASGGEASPVEPLVIRNANLTLIVEDPDKSADEIGKLADELGGYVVSSNVFQSSSELSSKVATRASVSIRVPVERLDEAIERIQEDVIEVRDRYVSGEDVTKQYTDLQSRLRSLEAAEEQLLQIMDDASDTEDVRNVYNDVRDVQEQIELIKGQINYFEDSARLSLINVDLIPDELAQPIQIGGWRPEGTAKQAVEALIRALQFLANVAIWVVIFVIPIALLLGVPGSYLGRRYRSWRKSRRERLEKEASEEAIE
jgi:hypothetical protein